MLTIAITLKIAPFFTIKNATYFLSEEFEGGIAKLTLMNEKECLFYSE